MERVNDQSIYVILCIDTHQIYLSGHFKLLFFILFNNFSLELSLAANFCLDRVYVRVRVRHMYTLLLFRLVIPR